MGRRGKTEDLNNKPFDRNADSAKKAHEFDQQFNQNRNKVQPLVEKKKGRHAK